MMPTWSTLPKTDCNSYRTCVHYSSLTHPTTTAAVNNRMYKYVFAFIARNHFPVACTCSLIGYGIYYRPQCIIGH